MTLLTFNRYRDLPETERIRRIGELIGKAVLLYRRDLRAAGRVEALVATREPGGPAALVDDAIEQRVVEYLARIGSASPHDLCVALGHTRTTVSRKLARLRNAGVLKASGKTKAIRYSLRTDFSAN
jgi:CRP-like cAMP-binding protein